MSDRACVCGQPLGQQVEIEAERCQRCLRAGVDAAVALLGEGFARRNLADLTVDEMIRQRDHLGSVADALGQIRDALDLALEERFAGDGAYLLGDGRAVQVTSTYRWVCEDPTGFWEWLGPDARRAFNPNYPLLGALNKIAEERGLGSYAAQDTFGRKVRGRVDVQIVPVEKKQWLGRLPERTIVLGARASQFPAPRKGKA